MPTLSLIFFTDLSRSACVSVPNSALASAKLSITSAVRNSPDTVLEKCKQIGIKAFDKSIGYLNEQYRKYCKLSGVAYTELPWRTRVYTWKEFYDEASAKHGQPFRDAISEFAADLQMKNPAMDLRFFSLAVCEEVWKWYEDKSPTLVLFFGSV